MIRHIEWVIKFLMSFKVISCQIKITNDKLLIPNKVYFIPFLQPLGVLQLQR